MDYVKMFSEWISSHEDISAEEAAAEISVPQESAMGHYTFKCFKFAKRFGVTPQGLAEKFVARPAAEWMENISAAGAYVNIFLNRSMFAEKTLADLHKKNAGYGGGNIGGGRVALVEYSSPNTAKHFHVGHLGSTIIGNALYKIFKFVGYKTVGLNYIGDWGTSFGKLITAYLHWGDKAEIERIGIDGLTKLYVRFHEEADADDTLNDEARSWELKILSGDGQGLSLWQWFCDMSMKEYARIYERLGVEFDVIRGESHYKNKLGEVVAELEKKGLLTESDGAKIVDLEDYKMPPVLILRRDGGTLYHTRDLAAAIDRREEYGFSICLIVTGSEQILYFNQMKKVLELMGHEWAADVEHIPYGLFVMEDGKYSSRRGNVIKMEDLLDEAVAKTLAIINEKNPALSNKEDVAAQVGIGAVIFFKLYNNRIKDVNFSFEHVLNFDGETGPYVQYAHARACSVLEKGGNFSADDAIAGKNLADDESFAVLRLLHKFPDAVAEAANKREPFLVSRHLVALAQAFNRFYHNRTVLTDEPELRAARLSLTHAVKTVLSNGLGLLGMAAPKKM
ncbi:MAG: arginine--tRNA ligase [Defluviitaleaceae bacterium]|nr:arginine--tRNA ligase [Defluviitaleaceae bacterium]